MMLPQSSAVAHRDGKDRSVASLANVLTSKRIERNVTTSSLGCHNSFKEKPRHL